MVYSMPAVHMTFDYVALKDNSRWLYLSYMVYIIIFKKKILMMFSTYNIHAEYIIIICLFNHFSYHGTYLPVVHLMAVFIYTTLIYLCNVYPHILVKLIKQHQASLLEDISLLAPSVTSLVS